MSSSGESSDGESDWQDLELDEEPSIFTSFFSDETFTTAREMLDHSKTKHNFDFLETTKRLKLDFYGAIKLVNFARTCHQKGEPIPADISATHLEDDVYLKPVLDNDTFLYTLDEILPEDGQEQDGGQPAVEASAATGAPIDDLLSRNKALEEELETLRDQFANYRLTVEETLDRRWGVDKDDATADEKSSSKPVSKGDESDYYFESYAAHEIHETMLKDAVRTDAYRDFIYHNKNLFKDKVVLDIGCGTGILSMFCAKAGAKLVIAVDKSEIMTKAMENVFHNGLQDKITCIKGAMEEVVLPVDQVDIIVSEWMGYFLLYEAMLPSVLYARDKYLKPGGLMVPSSMTMWMAPIADEEYVSDHVSFWRDVYGFDMKSMQEGIYEEARVEVVPAKSVCGKPFPFKGLDLYKVTKEDLSFNVKWKSVLERDVDQLDGLLIWFDNFFDTEVGAPLPALETTMDGFVKQKNGNVAFSTGPFTTPTHWKQGLLLMSPEESYQKLPQSCALEGELTYAVLSENDRALQISASWSREGAEQKKQSWKMK